MKIHKFSILLSGFMLITSCANVEELTGDTPIIDTQGVNMNQYQTDLGQCQAYADEVQIAQKTTAGAVTGAAVGSVFGAIVGNSGTAQRGAGIGAVGGGVRGASEGLREREQVIKRCLLGRGYRVLN